MTTTKHSRRSPNGRLAVAASEAAQDSDPPSSGPRAEISGARVVPRPEDTLREAAPSTPSGSGPRRSFSDAEISAYLRTDFLLRIVHDLRTPLGVTSGAIQELEATLGPDAAREHERLFSMAQRSLKKLARIADRLNLVAHLERARLELVRSPTDLVEIAKTAMKQALDVDARTAVAVRSELPGAPCLVLGDPRWLVPAIAELVGNAVRHAHRNACVRIEIDRGGTGGRTAPQDDVCLIVEDDGGGIKPSVRDGMFQRLVPRENERSLGLGLSIVHDVLEAHGGTLEIEAADLVPGGPRTSLTRFIVRLPRHDMATPGAR